jgi:hypothetical protein
MRASIASKSKSEKNMNKFAITVFAAISTLTVASPALATEYKLNCIYPNSGEAKSVTIEAESRSKAIDTVRDNPDYADYDRFK